MLFRSRPLKWLSPRYPMITMLLKTMCVLFCPPTDHSTSVTSHSLGFHLMILSYLCLFHSLFTSICGSLSSLLLSLCTLPLRVSTICMAPPCYCSITQHSSAGHLCPCPLFLEISLGNCAHYHLLDITIKVKSKSSHQKLWLSL